MLIVLSGGPGDGMQMEWNGSPAAIKFPQLLDHRVRYPDEPIEMESGPDGLPQIKRNYRLVRYVRTDETR